MIGKERVFVLHWSADRDPATSVYLSQRDIRELQFAKAAIATGWRILLEEAGLETADIKQVLLAGSFGSYLSAKSAIRIGLVPDVGPRRIIAAGNVAGEGAKMALLSVRDRAAALALLEEVKYVELSDRQRLQRPLHRPTRLLTPGSAARAPPAVPTATPAGR